jgi:uncharacterized membrane protein
MEKKSIEDLSNLVFGLALTLGAVALVRPDRNDFVQLFNIILNFALSFLIIIWMWYLYNRLINQLDMDRKSEVILNFILLFLVVIEPYLWTLINTSSGATLYALDIGTALLILGGFSHFIIQKARMRGENVKQQMFGRSITFALALVFYVSIIPGLISELQPYGVQGLIWLSVLLLAVLSRLRSDKSR